MSKWHFLIWYFLIWFGLLMSGATSISRADAPSLSPFTLPNGIRVIVLERHTSPLVAIALWVRAGAREEQKQEIGSAHFLEHTLFKGTTTRRAGDADIAIENLGAVLDAATGPDYAQFYTTVSRVHISAALEVLSDVIRNATLPEMEIEHERGVILDELAQHDADPTAHLIDLLYANSYASHPYARSPGGTSGAIRGLKRETLSSFYHRCYIPARCTLVLVGDCTTEQCRREVQRAFGDWRPSSPSGALTQAQVAADSALRPTPEAVPSHFGEIRAAIPYCMVGIAYPAPAAADLQMACAGMVAAALLGDARGGRVAVAALAGTEAAARYTPRQDGGLLTLTARIPEQGRAATRLQLAGLESNLFKVVESLQAAPPTQEEFNAARGLVLGRLQFDTETSAGMARALGYAAVVGGDTPEALIERIRRLTRSDLQLFCRRFLISDHRVLLRLLPTTDVTRNNATSISNQ